MPVDTAPDAYALAMTAALDRRALAMRALDNLQRDADRYHAFIGMHGGVYDRLPEGRMCEADDMRDAANDSAVMAVNALSAINIHAGVIAEFLGDAAYRNGGAK